MPSSRDKVAATVASALVAMGLVLGFANLGGPGSQRKIQADSKRVEDLGWIANAVSSHWRTHDHSLPSAAELRPLNRLDPITKAPYEYRALERSHYQLCATFAGDNTKDVIDSNNAIWRHPAGNHCFDLDATNPQMVYQFNSR